MSHWAQQYIGMPWTREGYGPDVFNCWGLAWWVQLKHYAREIPMYIGIPGDNRLAVARKIGSVLAAGEWVRLTVPEDGCMVGILYARDVHHVGVFVSIDGGLVLHACEGKGVLAQPLSALRINGQDRALFYRHSSWQK